MTNHHQLSVTVDRAMTHRNDRTGVIPVDTLVVFDERISDLEILAQALLPGSIGFNIDSQSDGLEVITNLLATTGAKYLAIVAHGEPGVVHLGKNPLDIQQLQLHSHQLQQWGVAEIALYSCEVAQGNIGRDLIYQLSELTGATVAGSATKTGSAALGGSWNLMITTDEITAPELFDSAILETYPSVLPIVGLVAGIVSPIEGRISGTFEINLDSPAPFGGTVVNFNTTGSTATPGLDYRLTAGAGITAITANSFTVAAGSNKAIINVMALRDTVIDPDEVITINTTAGIGYTIGDFVPKTDFAAGDGPREVSVGDFNGDDKLDLVTANSNSNNVSVLLGNGNGGFGSKTDFAAGNGARSVSVGDFNGDGKLDLATANANSNNLSVLLGNGSGGFAPKTDFTTGTRPYSISVGYFNNDDKLDLVTANVNSNSVSVLLGNGSGGFAPKTDFTTGSAPTSVTTGDFNGDGKLDLATANNTSNTISLLLGNGDGTFSSKTDFAAGSGIISVTTGDFNGDGKLDLATLTEGILQLPNTVYENGTVSVLLGNGSGGFAPTTNFVVGDDLSSISVGDFNGDGKLDVVTTDGSALVLLGNGSGGFAPKTGFATGAAATSVSVGDFNGDGKLDLTTANFSGDSVSVLLNNYDRTASQTIIDSPFARRNDFGNDKKSDILWRNDDGRVSLWQMNGSNVSNATVFATVSTDWKIANTGDFNGDSKADILWRKNDGSVAIWQMNGSNILSQNFVNPFPVVANSWKISGTGDFNGDSKSDILWRNDDGRVNLWQMDGTTMTNNSTIATVGNDWKISGTGDFNGDNKSDVLWRNDDGRVALWQMNGATLTTYSTVATVSTDWKISGTGDFNGDGKSDILWRNDNGSTNIWLMDGANVLSTGPIPQYPTVDNSWKIAGTSDFNGDGKSDILWRNDNGSTNVWEMNGANVLANNSTNPYPVTDNTWKISAPIT